MPFQEEVTKLLSDNRSKRFTLAVRDAVWALYYSVLTTVGAAFTLALSEKHFPTLEDVKIAAYAGLFLGLAHISRKYFTGPKQ